MPLSARITPYANTIKVLVDSRLSPKVQSERVAAFARQRIAEVDAQNAAALGAVPPKTVTVDGRQGAPLESVNPDRGTIIAEWRLVDDVLGWIMTTLRARSPRQSGDYIDGHIMLADDVESDPFNPPMARTFTFLNTVPYARKIEIGKTESGRDFVIQVENRIYIRTGDDAKAKFGNIAKIRTGFEPSSYLLKQNQVSRSFTGGVKRISARQRPDRVAGAAVSVPAIYVTIGG